MELTRTETAPSGAVRALAEIGLAGGANEALREVRHTITRFRITLSVIECTLTSRARTTLFTRQQIDGLALPSVHARVLKALW